MPRVRQKQAEYLLGDFVKDVQCRIYLSDEYRPEIARKLGVSEKTLYNYLHRPEIMKLSFLRGLIVTLKPPPELTLKMLGYSKEEIRELAREVLGGA